MKIDRQRKLTVATCNGKIDAQEISEAITKYYQGVPMPNTLWDLEQADLEGLSSDDIMGIAALVKEQRPQGLPGKTAIVASKDLSFGMSRMFETFTELVEHQVELQVFRSVDAAMAWMDE